MLIDYWVVEMICQLPFEQFHKIAHFNLLNYFQHIQIITIVIVVIIKFLKWWIFNIVQSRNPLIMNMMKKKIKYSKEIEGNISKNHLFFRLEAYNWKYIYSLLNYSSKKQEQQQQ